MGRGVRVFGSLACGAGIATLLTSVPAGAAEGSTIAVTPDEGLRDGQVVRVDGTGWPDPTADNQYGVVVQCADSGQGITAGCGGGRPLSESDVSASGRFSVEVTVRRSFRNFQDDATLTCGAAPDDCEIVAMVWTDFGDRIIVDGYDTEPISFVAPK